MASDQPFGNGGSPSAAARTAGPKPARPGRPQLRTDGVSAEARRQAAAILEVLAGVRTPTEVAGQLAISLTRYYIIESRALQGLIAACEPRPRGKVRTPASELAALRRECEQLRRQAARQQGAVACDGGTMGLDLGSGPSFSQIREQKSQEAAAETEARGRCWRRPYSRKPPRRRRPRTTACPP